MLGASGAMPPIGRPSSKRYSPLCTNGGLNSITTRGSNGHEMVDSVGIIHMNGRIYDPTLGRFLQADSFVAAHISK
jgi:RHS repeat-associated protein